jgi:hypothetical protein
MLFFANASTVTVTWQWVYGSEPTANVTVSGSALKASVVLANSTGTQITAQVQIQGNA